MSSQTRSASTMSDIKIATRGSRLALAQARWVGQRLSAAHPGLNVSIVEVQTHGDTDQITAVATLTEVGAFVRSVQRALLDGVADLAVHSCKDLPVDGPAGLLSFYPKREAPWDVLCGSTLEAMAPGARVGTGSPRRAAQMRRLRPDVDVQEIRGNVDTRLQKLEAGEFEAVILAEAGLRRLRREDEIGHRFSLEEMVPAPAQGALAIETTLDSPAIPFLEVMDDPATRLAVRSERALLGLTRAGCRSALGAFGDVTGRGIRLTGFVEDGNGTRAGHAEGATPDTAARLLQGVLGL